MKKVDVTIQTLNITIKSLVLNNKRFTKAVFNQLLNIDYWFIQYDEGMVLSNIQLNDCIGFVKDNYTDYYLLILQNGYLLKYLFLYNGVFRFGDEEINEKDTYKLHLISEKYSGIGEGELARFKYEFVEFIDNPANQIFIAL